MSIKVLRHHYDAGGSTMPEEPGEYLPPPRTLLVVDDDPLQRLLMATILTGEGYRVATAEHGQHALDLIALDPPDLILLDVQMPVMDGPTFARLYAQTPCLHAPLILISGQPEAAGCWPLPAPLAIFRKPIHLRSLFAVIRGSLSVPLRAEEKVGNSAWVSR
jgi:CheY-like chemotaxis protein